jgi:hypothetical protein
MTTQSNKRAGDDVDELLNDIDGAIHGLNRRIEFGQVSSSWALRYVALLRKIKSLIHGKEKEIKKQNDLKLKAMGKHGDAVARIEQLGYQVERLEKQLAEARGERREEYE